jgi:hypothetical protein
VKLQYVFDNRCRQIYHAPSGEVDVSSLFVTCWLLPTRKHKSQWRDLTSSDIELTNRTLAPLLAGNQDSIRFTKRYIHKDGSTIWAEVGWLCAGTGWQTAILRYIGQ